VVHERRTGVMLGFLLTNKEFSAAHKELSGGRVRLATGTLYTALDRLCAEGHVELVREEIVNGRVRRSYGLTPPGAGALRAEATRMAEAARLVIGRGARKAVRGARKASPA
jgi:DNA-binding PadR family transcriptional regulator